MERGQPVIYIKKKKSVKKLYKELQPYIIKSMEYKFIGK